MPGERVKALIVEEDQLEGAARTLMTHIYFRGELGLAIFGDSEEFGERGT